MSLQYWKYQKPFELESGAEISNLTLGYHTFGTRNADDSNVIWVFHALTANSNPLEWWPGLFGTQDFFNPSEYYIICVNVLGSPYGSTAPNSLTFPGFTVRDVVNAQLLLAVDLNIDQIKMAIGGSFGGNQALEFAYQFSGSIDQLILIASSARESAWGIAIHETQRLALRADVTFGQHNGGKEGLKAARAVGMLTYRTSEAFEQTQSDEESKLTDHKAASYIRYQGEKFEKRFNALSYYYLINCLDTHDIGRDRGGVHQALAQIKPNTLIIGITSDVLVPPRLQRAMADSIPQATYVEIDSEFGHDGFLIETKQLEKIMHNALNK